MLTKLSTNTNKVENDPVHPVTFSLYIYNSCIIDNANKILEYFLKKF